MVLIPLTFCFTNDRVMMSVSPAIHRVEQPEELMKTNASRPECPDRRVSQHSEVTRSILLDYSRIRSIHEHLYVMAVENSAESLFFVI
jgi:hypothetical protein